MAKNNLKTTLLGVPIARLSLKEALSACHDLIQNRQGGTACFVNVHTLTESQSNPALKHALQNATFSFADGLPLVWLSRWKGEKKVQGRVCGPDFMGAFLTKYKDLPQGFIGGTDGVGRQILQRFGLRGVAFPPPYRPFSVSHMEEDWKTFLTLWKKTFGPESVPPVVWIGLGAPKQEQWVDSIRALAPETFFFAVGAAFDFHSGNLKRAPRWIQRLGLEWSYRLSQEPSRLWARYLKYNSRFLRLSLKEILTESFS